MKKIAFGISAFVVALYGAAVAQTLGPRPFASNIIRASDLGAYGDGNTTSFLVTTDGSTGSVTFATDGSNPAPAFTAADVGKVINIPGAGSAGALLATTISAVSDATHITVANSTASALAGVAKNVTWGHDDTAALQSGLTQCKAVQLNDTAVYLTTGLKLANCKYYFQPPFGAASYGMVANARSTLKAITTTTTTPTYVVATQNWVDNTTYAYYPFTMTNITFDANSQATYGVINNSFGAKFDGCHAIYAVSHGFYEPGQTSSGVALSAGHSGGYYHKSDAWRNGGSGIYVPHADATHASVLDGMIDGGYWAANTDYQIYLGAAAGWIVRGVHADPASALGNVIYINQPGGGTVVAQNIFNGAAYINQLNTTWPVWIFGPANSISGTLTANISGSVSYGIVKSVQNTYYGTSSNIYFSNNTSARMFVSEGDVFQGSAPFKWTSTYSSVMQVQAVNSTLLGGGGYQANQTPCLLNGVVRPSADGQAYSCTDYSVTKTATSSATSIVFTITATVPGTGSIPSIGNAKGGTGLGFKGKIDVTSWSASTSETYTADLSGEASRVTGTTTASHTEAVSNAIDSGASISTTPSCSWSVPSTTADAVLTCTVTVTIPAATNSTTSQARLRLNFDNRQVTALTVQ